MSTNDIAIEEDVNIQTLRDLGIDPYAPAPSNSGKRLCGACSRGEHDNCSGWCFCPEGCANR